MLNADDGWMCRSCGYELDWSIGEAHVHGLSCPGCGQEPKHAWRWGGTSPLLPWYGGLMAGESTYLEILAGEARDERIAAHSALCEQEAEERAKRRGCPKRRGTRKPPSRYALDPCFVESCPRPHEIYSHCRECGSTPKWRVGSRYLHPREIARMVRENGMDGHGLDPVPRPGVAGRRTAA